MENGQLQTIQDQQARQLMISQLVAGLSSPVQEPERPGDIQKLLDYANNGNSAKLTIELKSKSVQGFWENVTRSLVLIMSVGVGVPFVYFALYILKNGPV